MAQYIFSNSSNGENGQSKGSYYIIGRVKSVTLGPKKYDGTVDEEYKSPEDLGKIRYEILYSTMDISNVEGSISPAYPIFSSFRQYPMAAEIVFIIPGPSQGLNDSRERQKLYYFPPYSLWNSVNHNAFPNLQEYADYLKEFYANAPNGFDAQVPNLPIGNTFIENPNVRSLSPFEGDTIVESRFGQSIRFGSTNLRSKTLNTWSKSGEPGKPITIIRNGQGPQSNNDKFELTVENINKDNSSIWLTSGQQIDIDTIESFPFQSFGLKINETTKVTTIASKPTSTTSISATESDNLTTN